MYLTYDEYQQMGGALSASDFNRFEFKARTLINGFTFSRFSKLSELPEQLKRLTFELVELLIKQSEGAIASESQSQGGVSESVTYVTGAQQGADRLIYDYLHEVEINGVLVLYKGREYD